MFGFTLCQRHDVEGAVVNIPGIVGILGLEYPYRRHIMLVEELESMDPSAAEAARERVKERLEEVLSAISR
jgi:hypothetical protein